MLLEYIYIRKAKNGSLSFLVGKRPHLCISACISDWFDSFIGIGLHPSLFQEKAGQLALRYFSVESRRDSRKL